MEKLLSKSQYTALLMNVIKASDMGFLQHGVRVSYLMNEFAARAKLNDRIKRLLTLVSIVIDLGAFSSEKFSLVAKVEEEDLFAHAAYGATYVKYLFGTTFAAKIVLHHHDRYNPQDKTVAHRYGLMLHLMDRMDVMQMNGYTDDEIKRKIMADSGTVYNPQDVPIALAMIDDGILEYLRNGAAPVFMDEYFTKNQLPSRIYTHAFNAIIRVFDMYTPQTVAHSLTVTLFASEIAKRMKLKRSEVRDVKLAAMLHDIGKVAIPADILEKPSALEGEEIAIMHTHVDFTESILVGNVSDRVLDAAVRHHEKLDGSGYPRGLKGGELTVYDRIIAVADMLSALYAPRTYKPAMTEDEVLAVLRHETDEGRIDGEIVMAYVKDIGEINYMYQREFARQNAWREKIHREANLIISTRAPVRAD